MYLNYIFLSNFLYLLIHNIDIYFLIYISVISNLLSFHVIFFNIKFFKIKRSHVQREERNAFDG